jgi:hypothetical protein
MTILRWHSVGHLTENKRLSGSNKQFTFVTTCFNLLWQYSKPFCITPKKSRSDIHDIPVDYNGQQTISDTPWQHNFSPMIFSHISTFRREYIQMKEDWNIWPCQELNPTPCICNLNIRWRWQWLASSPGWFTSRKRIRVLLWIGRWLEYKPAWNINHVGSWTLEVKSTADSLYWG